MRRIAVAMAKGGVGKTTTAVHLADGLARRGRRVLLVDCDTQGQTTRFLGVNPAFGLYEFVTGHDLRGQRVARGDTIHSARRNLWVLGGGIGLVELKNWLGEQPRDVRQTILGQTLVPKQGALDDLIFDCAPGWDVLSVNVLMAVDEILCPVAVQAPALEGLKTFFGYLLSAQKLNEDLQLRYVIPTMFDRRTNQSFEIHRQLRKLFLRQICEPIRYTIGFSQAAGRGKTLFEVRGRSGAAQDYDRLVRRYLEDGRQPHEDRRPV